MTTITRARFQEAAVRHIVSRFADPDGSKRVLLADEVGLGKTVVARGVIEKLQEGRRKVLKVIYLCSNAEIAEQNRIKLDPASGAPVGRVTELALDARAQQADLRLYSFTPGTSLRDGTGMEWERRLLMYLLYRAFGLPVWKRRWREFFRCGVRPARWLEGTSRRELWRVFKGKTKKSLQTNLASAWRKHGLAGQPPHVALASAVAAFNSEIGEQRAARNRMIAQLRRVMQIEILRELKPDLLILDEVQRFRDVLEQATNPDHITAALFARRVPVLILSATPYRALTLGHELTEGIASHHEDFFKTLDFLFEGNVVTPARIRSNLQVFGDRLRSPNLADTLDRDLLALKHDIEDDLRKVICRTERNWYLLDRRKGMDDSMVTAGEIPARLALEEFFRLQHALAPLQPASQITEFWKSAPSLLTFMDARYAIFRKMRDDTSFRVPRGLLTTGRALVPLGERNHRVSRAVVVALGAGEAPPSLWSAPSYTYYRDQLFGSAHGRKLLVFSGWRFVPKAVAVIVSQIATERMKAGEEAATQPLRFSERLSFHTFDVCFPSAALAAAGDEAYRSVVRRSTGATASDVFIATRASLRRYLDEQGIAIVAVGGDPLWRVALRLEARVRGRAAVEAILNAWSETAPTDTGADHIWQHRERLTEWLRDDTSPLRLTEKRFDRLALIAAFSPANCLVRALRSVFPEEADAFLPQIAGVTLGPLRRYFNKPHVQQILRQHEFKMPWDLETAEDEHAFTDRVLVYAADAHFQTVIDEYAYLLRHAAQAKDAGTALETLARVWGLGRGTPRTNGPRGSGMSVRINPDAKAHTTHFAMAFGDEEARDTAPDDEEEETKQRKSVVREAFNSPFWPFVLATTSVGQEGLDFHLYCRDVMHWNLPSNPVDLEQREGRVNRRDSLAVRQSIAHDWPLESDETWNGADDGVRNPWTTVFDSIRRRDDIQNYKHGLFPHWVYECRDPQSTVRIVRHVPFFATSRDARRYERLKTGLALYRLVFGQVNQEDLLETLQRQIEARPREERDHAFRRLATYMLNLSPIGHDEALAHATQEADELLSDREGTLRLLEAVDRLRAERAAELSVVAMELDGLLAIVYDAVSSGLEPTESVRSALTALAYLRNPYDRIFDLHVEGGFSDDIEIIRTTWTALVRAPSSSPEPICASPGSIRPHINAQRNY